MSRIADVAFDALHALDDTTALEADLLKTLKSKGVRQGRPSVIKELDADVRFERTKVLGKTAWTVTDDVPPPQTGPVRTFRPEMTGPPVTGDPFDGLTPRDWQVTAFGAWAAADLHGVVEAITGSGKTYVAVMAIRVALSKDGRVLVLVPTIDLQDQWVRTLRKSLPRTVRIGRLGGGGEDDLFDCHVLVATMTSGGKVEVEPPPGHLGLLISDEAHRIGADTFSQALRPAFQWRLALTATYERNDEALEEVVGPYFGGVVHSYGYAEAAADGVIAPFKVALVEATLSEQEAKEYGEADAKVKSWRRELVGLGMPKHPLALIAAASARAAAATGFRNQPREVVASRGFLSALRKRRDVAAQAQAKLDTLEQLAPHLKGRRTLVFTDTVDQAYDAVKALKKRGVEAEEIHGGLPTKKRRIRLAQFANGNLQCVVAPRVLDEGVDVPEAEIAVVLAAFASRRQMVQRLGRVLRVTDDAKVARLVVVHAGGTREDPEKGAHSDFLDEVVPVAKSVESFGPDVVTGMLTEFFGA